MPNYFPLFLFFLVSLFYDIKFYKIIKLIKVPTHLINVPTHKLGKTLDLLLTDKPGLMSGVLISDFKKPCQSDHLCVSFSSLV